MLTNFDIEKLAKRMDVPLAFCGFKDDLPKTIKPNKYYCINMEDEFDKDGERNDGSHWTGFIVQKNATGKVTPLYFDSFGSPPPQIVTKTIQKNFDKKIDWTTPDVQSLMSNACGWYQLAWAHYCLGSEYRTGNLKEDTADFLDNFEDLNKSCDFKKNEWVLKHFFRAKDPALRKPVDVLPDSSKITESNPDPAASACAHVNGMKIPVDVNYNES